MLHLLLFLIYLSFISLGLPDSLLGSAWPAMYHPLGVPLSYAGIVSMIIALGTVLSSLASDRLKRRLGTGRVCALSVGMTAAALWGFSASGSFAALCLWAIPYGLGAGSVDAALNNYVALHYASRHMNWLHCMWGVGASLGPYVMGWALTGGRGWNAGYRDVAVLQTALCALVLLSLPLWRRAEKTAAPGPAAVKSGPLSLGEILRIPGAVPVMLAFFCYCALEQTTGLWASSYLVLVRGLAAEQAAGWASLFFGGITAGRLASGFLSIRLSDRRMVLLGQLTLTVGIVLLALPLGQHAALTALVLLGLGCAPIYPALIHSTPANFGAERSQALIGVQMASAYIGNCLMPPLFGLLARSAGAALLPAYLCVLLALMAAMYRLLVSACTPRGGK